MPTVHISDTLVRAELLRVKWQKRSLLSWACKLETVIQQLITPSVI